MASAVMALGMGALTSCDDDKVYDVDHQEANIIGSITFNYEGKLIMPIGAELQLKVNVEPADAADTGFIYKSSNPDIAYIDDLGVLHCVGLGIANVSAVPSIGFGATATLEVTVNESVVYSQSMTIDGVNELAEYHYLGDEFQLKPVILPEDHTYSYVSWATSDPEVIAIDQEGNVVCGKEGTATVTATTKAPDIEGISGSLTLTVSPSANVEDIEIAPYTDLICLEKPFDLDVTYYPSYGNPSTVEWESSDESIAIVTKGHVVPTGFGTCTLTGTTPTGVSKSVSITVETGWHVWDVSNRFIGWAPATAGQSFEYYDDYVINRLGNGGTTYRADIRYACDNNSPLVMHFGQYPVVALRTTIPDSGRNTFDVKAVDGTGDTPQCNFGRFATGNPIRLDDGSVLIYVDWGARNKFPLTTTTPFGLFQIKIADILVDETPVDYYKIYWIRTFKSVDDMKAFAEAEVAAGK